MFTVIPNVEPGGLLMLGSTASSIIVGPDIAVLATLLSNPDHTTPVLSEVVIVAGLLDTDTIGNTVPPALDNMLLISGWVLANDMLEPELS
jgi:hypothetical protein